MSKEIYSGLESSGKSLMLAMVVEKIAYRNSAWYLKSGIVRPILSNLRFSDEFYKLVTQELGISIFYWDNLDELIRYDNADVIIDEVGNYFDSRMWQDLSLDVRRWLTQGAKSGIEIYGSAQDFAQVDKSFRRLVNADGLHEITKIVGSPRPSPTKPPIKRIWGLCVMKDLNPRSYNEDKKQFASGSFLPKFFFIQKKYCDMFDTTQKIKRSLPPLMRHEERFCEHHKTFGGNGECTFCKVVHI